jgi:hypothetical protein
MKLLATTTVFAGVTYSRPIQPESGVGDPCEQTGQARLYGISYLDGQGPRGG